jgi:hypothetical protein
MSKDVPKILCKEMRVIFSSENQLGQFWPTLNRTAFERGRHLGLHTSDRICNICKTGDVENESNFLFKCEKYSNYRRSLQCNILSILQKNHLSENQMLKFCMHSNLLKVLRVTCSYINNCLTLRNEIIQYS